MADHGPVTDGCSPSLGTELGSQRTQCSGFVGVHFQHACLQELRGGTCGTVRGWGAPWLPPLQRIAIPKVSLWAGEQLKASHCLPIVFHLPIPT